MSTKPEDVTFEAADGLKVAKRTARRLKTAFRSLGMDDFRFRLIERTEYDMYQSRYGVLVSQQRKTDAERPAQPEHVDIRTQSGVLLLQILVNHYDSKDQILEPSLWPPATWRKAKMSNMDFDCWMVLVVRRERMVRPERIQLLEILTGTA